MCVCMCVCVRVCVCVCVNTPVIAKMNRKIGLSCIN